MVDVARVVSTSCAERVIIIIYNELFSKEDSWINKLNNAIKYSVNADVLKKEYNQLIEEELKRRITIYK